MDDKNKDYKCVNCIAFGGIGWVPRGCCLLFKIPICGFDPVCKIFNKDILLKEEKN